MKWLALFLAIAWTCAAAEKISVQRTGTEGDSPRWKLTITASLPPQTITRIATMGDVTVRGKRSGGIRYTITQDVIAPDEASVRQLARQYRVQAGSGQIGFFQPGALSVEIPRASPFLALSSNAGTIDAADLDGSLLAGANAGTIVLDRIGGNVEIHSNGGATSLGSIGGSVRCYSGGGSIRAIKINGQAYFETEGGDIQVGEVLGAVTALTGAGGIRIDRARAGVLADTFGGLIEIGNATSVQCRNAGGAIRLTNVSGSLSAATQRGSIVAEILAGRPLEDSVLSTGAGDITVLIPSNMGVTIEAETSEMAASRPIVSDFSGLQIRARRSSVIATGNINGGGPRLRLIGAGGRIEIRRK
ncbi:MAG: hypothetical protein QOJ99_3691 [Bryobacterales bacterium]|nr:hypothetical protein [Bryobacterales bacterium]